MGVSIKKTQGNFSVVAEDETGGEGNLTQTQMETIDEVLDYYGGHDAQWLSRLSHLEDPWNEVRIGIPRGVGCNRVITKESMAMYYGGI